MRIQIHYSDFFFGRPLSTLLTATIGHQCVELASQIDAAPANNRQSEKWSTQGNVDTQYTREGNTMDFAFGINDTSREACIAESATPYNPAQEIKPNSIMSPWAVISIMNHSESCNCHCKVAILENFKTLLTSEHKRTTTEEQEKNRQS